MRGVCPVAICILIASCGHNDVDLRTALAERFEASGEQYVLWSGVRGPAVFTRDAGDVVKAMAAAAGCEIGRDEYGIACVYPSVLGSGVGGVRLPGEVDPREYAEADIHSVMLAIAREANRNLAVGPGVSGRISGSVDTGEWRSALASVIPSGFVLAERGGVVRIVQRPPASGSGPAEISCRESDVREVVELIEEKSGLRCVVRPDVEGIVSMHVYGVPWRHVLSVVADAVGADVLRNQDGDYVLVKRPLEEMFSLCIVPALVSDLVRSGREMMNLSVTLELPPKLLEESVSWAVMMSRLQYVVLIGDLCGADVFMSEDPDHLTIRAR